MYSLKEYEALERWVYRKLIRGEGSAIEQWASILWLDANNKELLREYHRQLFDKCKCKLCAKCEADVENWQEVFGETHKCK